MVVAGTVPCRYYCTVLKEIISCSGLFFELKTTLSKRDQEAGLIPFFYWVGSTGTGWRTSISHHHIQIAIKIIQFETPF